MTIASHIGAGECRSFSGHALEYPNPGEARTISQVQSIGFKRPTNGKCFTKASKSNSTTLAPYITTGLTTPSSATTTTKSEINDAECKSLPLLIYDVLFHKTETVNEFFCLSLIEKSYIFEINSSIVVLQQFR